MPSVFRGIIDFFGRLGVYDVLLPFLLIFTITFAIFEKTKIFGVEKIEGKDYTRKNLNAMAAFVIAFLVVASSRLVALINEAMANIIVLMMMAIAFLMLVGTFYGEKEDVFKALGKSRYFFIVLIFIGVILIFMQAIKTESGESWLNIFWGWIYQGWNDIVIGTIVLLIIIIVFIWLIVREPRTRTAKTEVSKEEGGK